MALPQFSTTTAPTPAPHVLRVAAALERLAFDASACADAADTRAQAARRATRIAYGIGDTELYEANADLYVSEASERAFFRRARTAYTNALAYWHRGVRPERLPSGAYILPSVGSGQGAHLITKSGDWCCCCDAGSQMHWPIAMLIGMEIVSDELDVTDAAPKPLPFEPERRATRTETRKQIIVSWSEGEIEQGRTFYPRTEAGAASAARKLTKLAAQGYTLAGPVDIPDEPQPPDDHTTWIEPHLFGLPGSRRAQIEAATAEWF